MKIAFSAILLAAAFGLAGTGGASAESVMKVCGDQWKQAKANGQTNGMTWKDFLAQCREQQKNGGGAAPAAAAPAPAAPAPAATAAAGGGKSANRRGAKAKKPSKIRITRRATREAGRTGDEEARGEEA